MNDNCEWPSCSCLLFGGSLVCPQHCISGCLCFSLNTLCNVICISSFFLYPEDANWRQFGLPGTTRLEAMVLIRLPKYAFLYPSDIVWTQIVMLSFGRLCALNRLHNKCLHPPLPLLYYMGRTWSMHRKYYDKHWGRMQNNFLHHHSLFSLTVPHEKCLGWFRWSCTVLRRLVNFRRLHNGHHVSSYTKWCYV